MQIFVRAKKNHSKEMECYLNQKKVLQDLDTKIGEVQNNLNRIRSGVSPYDSAFSRYLGEESSKKELEQLKSDKKRIQYEISVMNNIVTQLKLSNSETYKYEIVNNIIRECNILCENGIVLDSLLLPKNEVNFVKDMLSKTTLKTEYECIIPKFEVFNNTITIVDFRVLECYSSKDLWRVADLIFSCNDEQEV